MINTILIIISVGAVAAIVYGMYTKAKSDTFEFADDDLMTMDRLLEEVKSRMLEFTETESFEGAVNADFNATFQRQNILKKSLKRSVYGIASDKAVVISLIVDIIQQMLPTEEDVQKVKNLTGAFVDVGTMFEILMFFYKKEHGNEALSAWIEEFELDEPKYSEREYLPQYFITEEDVRYSYAQKNFELDYNAQITILATLLFQQYKGFGAIDTVLEMKVNGCNIGTSGRSLKKGVGPESRTRSAWLYYHGKQIHLQFINFVTDAEMARIVSSLIKFNSDGPLTVKNPHRVGTMWDSSRVNAFRPPAADRFVAFVRKFEADTNLDIKLLLDNMKTPDKSPVSNTQIIENLIKYMALGEVTIAFTGTQGTGKTTFLKAAVEHINPMYTLRVLEMTFELYLNELYPKRNILTVQETNYLPAKEAQDGLKKSDAIVSMAGEVATDEVAVNMLQFAQIASVFTWFSHHAMTPDDLANGLANSIVAVNKSMPVAIALEQVVNVIPINVHMNINTKGVRYVERITEIIPVKDVKPLPFYDPTASEDSINEITREYYKRRTESHKFTTKDIVVFNEKTMEYELKGWFTPRLTKHILSRLPDSVKSDFKEFAKREGVV